MNRRSVRFALVAAIAAVPLAMAMPMPGVGTSGAPGDTTCAACPTGGSGTGRVVVTSTSGMTSYTPGAGKHFAVNVSGSGGNAGLEVTERPAVNLSAGGAGNFVATATTNVTCLVGGTACAAGNPQYIRGVSATALPARRGFDWIAPSGKENVTPYVASPIRWTGQTYLASYVPIAAEASLPTLSVAPAGLSFSYQTGGAAPAAQTLTVSGVATTYATAASGGKWLSIHQSSGSVFVTANPAGLAAGSYSGSVTITAAGSAGSPKTVPVTLTVNGASPTLTVSPGSMTYFYQIGGVATRPHFITVGGVASTFTAAASGGTWLSIAPSANSVSVSTITAGLAPGSYSGSVTITAPGSLGSPKTVPVTLTVAAGGSKTLTVSPASLTFASQTGGAAPAAQTLAIGGVTTTFTATAAASGGAWLSVTPASNSVSVSVNTVGMAAGTYSGTVTIVAPGSVNGTQVVSVNLTVSSPAPPFQITPGTLSFRYDTANPVALPLVLNVASGATPADYTAAASGGVWLSVAPAGGTTPGGLFVSINPAGLAVGTYNGSVAITTVTPPTTTQSIPVTLTVTNSGSSACPFPLQ